MSLFLFLFYLNLGLILLAIEYVDELPVKCQGSVRNRVERAKGMVFLFSKCGAIGCAKSV